MKLLDSRFYQTSGSSVNIGSVPATIPPPTSIFSQFTPTDVSATYPEPPPAHSNTSRSTPRTSYQAPVNTVASMHSSEIRNALRSDHPLNVPTRPIQTPHLQQYADQVFSSNSQPRSQTTPSPINTAHVNMQLSEAPVIPPSPYQSLNSLRTFTGFPEPGNLVGNTSPVNTPVSTNAQTNMNTEDSYGTVSLQDLADISSHREKLPSEHSRIANGGQQQLIHQQLQHLAQPIPASPSSHTSSPQVHMGGSPHTPQLTQVGSSPVHQQQSTTPVQAPADSTTKPKKPRIRSNKKKKGQQTPPAIMEKYEHVSSQPPLHVPQALHAAGFPGGPLFEPVMQLGTPQSTYQNMCKYEGTSPIYNDTASLGAHLLQANSIMMDQPIPQFPEEDKDSVFMTNTCGNAFFNPRDDVKMEPEDGHALEDNLGLGLNPIGSPRKYRTKAEQKQVPVIIDDPEFEEEFGHLAPTNGVDIKTEPEDVRSHPNNPHGENPHNPRNPHGYQQNQPLQQPQQPEPPQQAQPPPPKASPFQNSFLSFLQGNKPETLSSVTNSSVPRKPAIKYIPEPPRPKLPAPPKKFSDSEDDNKIAFSDDDEDSKGETSLSQSQKQIKKTVSNVITSLGKEKTPSKVPNPQPSSSSHSAEKPKVPPLKISLAKVVVPTHTSKASKGRKSSGSSKKKRKSTGDEARLDKKFDPNALVKERPTRKAKEKTEAKKKQREALSKYWLGDYFQHQH